MTRRVVLFAIVLAVCPVAAQSVPGLKVPPGFVVTEYAGDDLAHDIYTMTFDPRGRVVVAGRGYIKVLIDDDGDGKADRAVLVADTPKGGAMGLLWEGDTLYAVGDQGLNRFKIGPDGMAAGPSELVYKFKATGEHDAHAIKRGGDGWLYWLCGNSAGVSKTDDTSAAFGDVTAGALLRFAPNFERHDIVADGFRNAYDFDFDAAGVPFTYDSDNERCIGLPWYEGTRFYRIVPNGHYGWLNPQRMQTWRLPPYSPDVVRPIVDLGRGSPTGVACYRHRLFPERYRGGFFLGDWTFGRLWFVNDTGAAEAFLKTDGDVGFAPTAVAVHPTTGELYVSVGGRGTRGGVYRISYPAGASAAKGYRTPALPEPASTAFRKSPVQGRLSMVCEAQSKLGGLGANAARGTAFEGYSRRLDAADASEVAAFARGLFPTSNPDIDRELSRALALVEDAEAGTLTRVLAKFSADFDPVEDIHYLIVTARLQAMRTDAQTRTIAATLVGLDRKFIERKRQRDSNWPLRVAEVHAELAKKDAALNAALLAHPDFARPGNALLTRCPGFDRTAAAAKFLAASSAKDFAWSGELVQLLADLPPEQYLPLVAALWERGGLDGELIELLAQHPRADDRDKFRAGLRSPKLERIAK